ncbi:MAG: septum formation initiator family protein [Cocleimonas sp.]
MKVLLIIFSLLLILLLVGLWVGPGSYPERWRIDDRKLVQESSNKEKKDQIRKMRAELDDISTGKDALEERARSQLGMTKKGETFFEVIMQPEKDEDNKADKNSTTSKNKKTVNE